jgi:hypothetical protein
VVKVWAKVRSFMQRATHCWELLVKFEVEKVLAGKFQMLRKVEENSGISEL